MYRKGHITLDTFCWNQAFGQRWKTLRETLPGAKGQTSPVGKQIGVLAILFWGALLFFGAFVGFQTGLGFRVMNLPMTMLGGVLFLGGLILFVAGPRAT
jgi:hypothetical protein